MTSIPLARTARPRRLALLAASAVAATAMAVTVLPRTATAATAVVLVPPQPTSLVITGTNDYAQLARTNMPAALRTGAVSIKAVSAGDYHAMALTASGAVYDWSATVAQPPVVPPAPSGVYAAIAAGGHFGLGLTSTGQIVGWGSNNYGQLNFPILPPGQTYTQIAAGYFSSIALTSTGAVITEGLNNEGKASLSCNACTAVASDTGLGAYGFNTAVRAGSVHRGLYQDEIITIAGNQPMRKPAPYAAVDFGGQAPPPAYNQYAHLSAPGERIVSISSGSAHTIGLSNLGRVYGWGSTLNGQTDVPAGLTSVTAISAGFWSSAALRTDGSIVTWGNDVHGELDFPSGQYSGIALGTWFGIGILKPALIPRLVTQPLATTVSAGSPVTFTASAAGNDYPTPQWQRCTNLGATCTNITGATSTSITGSITTTTYTLPTTTVAQNNTSYRAVFANSLGTATTSQAILTITEAPVITTQPQSQTITPLTTVILTATADGNPLPTVLRWDSCASTSPISCAPTAAPSPPPTTGPTGITSTLIITPTGYRPPRYYRAVFTNPHGTTATTIATITVQ